MVESVEEALNNNRIFISEEEVKGKVLHSTVGLPLLKGFDFELCVSGCSYPTAEKFLKNFLDNAPANFKGVFQDLIPGIDAILCSYPDVLVEHLSSIYQYYQNDMKAPCPKIKILIWSDRRKRFPGQDEFDRFLADNQLIDPQILDCIRTSVGG